MECNTENIPIIGQDGVYNTENILVIGQDGAKHRKIPIIRQDRD